MVQQDFRRPRRFLARARDTAGIAGIFRHLQAAAVALHRLYPTALALSRRRLLRRCVFTVVFDAMIGNPRCGGLLLGFVCSSMRRTIKVGG